MLSVVTFGRGAAWFDTGTVESFYDAQCFIRTVENVASISVAMLEEIAYNNGWIDRDMLINSASRYGKSSYGKKLLSFANSIVF